MHMGVESSDFLKNVLQRFEVIVHSDSLSKYIMMKFCACMDNRKHLLFYLCIASLSIGERPGGECNRVIVLQKHSP